MSIFDNIKNIFAPRIQSQPEPVKRPEQPISEQADRQNVRMSINQKAIDSWGGNISELFGGGKYPGALQYQYNSFAGLNHDRLRERSRKCIWDSLQAKALIDRLADNVINSGLTLESYPIWTFLQNYDEEQKYQITHRIEMLWKMYTNSKEPDYTGRRTLQQMQKDCFRYYLIDGEVFCILRYNQDRERLNPLTIQFVDPKQVINPHELKYFEAAKNRGNTIQNGIEYNKAGEEAAYYIQDTTTGKINRVVRRGPKSKRTFVLHFFTPQHQGQLRGVPFLSTMLHEFKKLTDYQLAEIQAAVVNAMLAVWVEPSEKVESSRPFTQGIIKKSEYQPEQQDQIVSGQRYEGAFYRPGIMVQNLKAGEKIQSFDTKRPNVNFDLFMASFKKNISSAASVPVEVMDMLFGSNYSASRAAIVFFWNVVSNFRADMAADFCRPIYHSWMIGEIEAGRLPEMSLSTPVLRHAWINSVWVGINKPSIDPLKESKAVENDLKIGLSTREKESQNKNGTSFEENVEKLKMENQKLADANAPLINAGTEKQ